MSDENTASELSEDMEVIGPGQMLAEGRIKMGLSQEQVADKLNFRPVLVRNIEAEIFDKSLPTTFNRGYLRNYAKLVGISVEQVLASYEMLGVAETQGAELQSFSKITEKQAETNLLMWISYLIVALLIGSTVMWWLQNVKEETSTTVLPKKVVAVPADVASKRLDVNSTTNNKATNRQAIENGTGKEVTKAIKQESVETVENNRVIASTLTEQASADVNSADTTLGNTLDSTVTSTPESNVSTSAEIPVEATKPAVLADKVKNNQVTQEAEQVLSNAVFTFSGDCYVNIFGADGERIAYGLKKSGYVMKISGVAPLNITLGRPELVAISFDGQSVDMSKYPGGNIAKFTLPVSPE